MKKKLSFVLLLLSCTGIFSQVIETDPTSFSINIEKMNEANTQFELNFAARSEFDRADATLNYIYQQILKDYSENTIFIEKFVNAQRA